MQAWAGLLVLLLFILYKWVTTESAGAPPVYSYLRNALVGQYNMKKEGPVQLVLNGYRKLGECFSLQVLHQRATLFVGPEAQGFFFSLRDNEADQRSVAV